MAALAGRRVADVGKLSTILLFLPPALLLFTLFVVLPVGEAAWYSGFNWNGFGKPTNWIGLDNYRFVFDNRVTVRHDLTEGDFDQCHACRNPISVEDRQSEHYAPGISCPHCWDSLSEKTRASAIERQKQIELARLRNEPHPIGRDPRLNATPSLEEV